MYNNRIKRIDKKIERIDSLKLEKKLEWHLINKSRERNWNQKYDWF